MSIILKYSKIHEFIILFSVIYLVFFYDVLANSLGFYDEILALYFMMVIIVVLLFSKKIFLYKNEKNIVILLSFIGFIGLLSNYLSYLGGNVTDTNAIIGDFINLYKAFIVYFGIRLISSKFNAQNVLKKTEKHTRFLFNLIIILLFFDIIFKLFPQLPRYGIHSYQLFFLHPSRFSFVFSFVFLVLFNKYIKSNKKHLLFILIIGLTSLRVKYFGFVVLAIFLMYYRHLLFKISKKTIFILIGLLFVLIGLLFQDQIKMYFSFDNIKNGWSRGILLMESIKIGYDYFPFGTGFGSYSCYFSGKYYSWVYDKYGINNVWGISRFYWGFVSDQFWPMVLGQFGYFGLLAYLLIIYQYIVLFLKFLKSNITNIKNSNYMFTALLGMLLLLIDSSSDAIFTQNRAVVLFILFALFINSQSNKTIEKNTK